MGTGSCRSSVASIFLGILFLVGSSLSEKAPYNTFARDATAAPSEAYYDYIIVGGGTSGCGLAATLSEGSKVLLLERGGLPYGNPNISNINGFAATLADTSPTSASQPFISTDGVFNHRARVLGGGSALNAGFYSRADPEFLRTVSWDPILVRESYEWVEKKVVFQPSVIRWQSAVKDGLLEAGFGPYNGFTFDHLLGTKVGGTIFDATGHRHTAADLLENAIPSSITVYLHATACQILFITEGVPRPRAYGVLFRDSKGSGHVALLNKGPKNEVILSAGSIGSPQILMLSGIGPARELIAHGIKVVLHHPMVGQGISDNPMNAIVIPSPQPVEVSLIQIVGITPFGSYVEAASGSVGFNWFRTFTTAFNDHTNQTGRPFTAMTNESSSGKIDLSASANFEAGIILEKVKGPLSKGHLELLSRNPDDNPKVTFNYFENPIDLQRCVDGIETIRKVIGSKSFSSFRYPFATAQSLMDSMLAFPVNLRPRHVSGAFSTEQFCKDTVMTIWHYHGGCQVGKVVDSDYRVIGVEALRVIDGSTFHDSPGTNPQATVMMFGRYMGQRILRDRVSWGGKE